MYMVWCVRWNDRTGQSHIEWNVPDPEKLKRELIEMGVDPDEIDVYEKDVS